MSKGKRKHETDKTATVATDIRRPIPDPWATSAAGGRRGTTQARVPILLDNGTPDGVPSRVRNTLGMNGTPDLSRPFTEHLDKGVLRLEFAAYLRGYYRNDRVARLAIQSLAEADILSQISVGKRNRAWTAKEVFPVINAFEWDIATPDDPEEERRPSPSKGRRAPGISRRVEGRETGEQPCAGT